MIFPVQPRSLTPLAAFALSNQSAPEPCAQEPSELRAQKRQRVEAPRQQALVEQLTLCKYIDIDSQLFSSLGWNEFVHECRGQGDMGNLDFEHPAAHLLSHIGKKGVPVMFTTLPWDNQRIYAAATRGPHKSAYEYQDFLRTEMVDMILR